MNMKFKIYVDYTAEEVPRPFYVGKGNDRRVSDLCRNKLHSAIKNKYGINRQIVFETTDETKAFDKERELIFELKTFIFDADSWGANFTRGGEGISGHKHTDESKRKNSESNKISTSGEKNGMFGKHHSEETRKKIGDNQRGWHQTDEAKAKISQSASRLNRGRKASEEARRKISESRKGKEPWNKGKKLGKRDIPRVFSEQARINISEGCKGRIPWNKGKKKHIDDFSMITEETDPLATLASQIL